MVLDGISGLELRVPGFSVGFVDFGFAAGLGVMG